ncbi:MAG: cytidylate kinase-like family protein [Lachnospiraceae bacterium]|nr:cytidylate kinase-like family protein [Lachnospiraceae bacterium]
MIISIGREYGSGGHEIGEKLAQRFNIPMYDKNLLYELGKDIGISPETLEKYDEKPRNLLLSRNVKGYSNSPEDIVAEMQFKFFSEKAKAGESFVIVGRCSDSILDDDDSMISIFIRAEKEERIARLMKKYEIDREQAIHDMAKTDKRRSTYHNNHCRSKWGDASSYDMCINSSKVGIDGTVELIANFVEMKREQLQ